MVTAILDKLSTDQKKKAIYERFIGYRRDPVAFAIDVIGVNPEYIWDGVVKICSAIRDHQKVAIRAGHTVSKTFTLGRIIVPWFKTCFQPSTVITTAPSDNQVKNQLWREIHTAQSSSKVPLGGKITGLMWDVKPQQSILDGLEPNQRALWEKNFAIGFSTSPDVNCEQATKIQGWHNEWVLVVIDEGCGVHPQIIRTAQESLITDDHCKIVISGNPTDPESQMARACFSSNAKNNEGKEPYISDEGFYVVTIDARDNPNYLNKSRIIPGLASYEYIQDIIKKYGENGDSTRYRVKGLFPTHKEGTYYGRELAQARRENRVGHYPHNPIYPVYTFNDFGDSYTAGIHVQFIEGRVRVISDYWDKEGMGAPAWSAALDSLRDSRNYCFRGHYAGPDLNPISGSNRRAFATGELLTTTLRKLGKDVKSCEPHGFDEGIDVVRSLWPLLEINEPECQTFIQAASGYCKLKNLRLSSEDQPSYHKQAALTWHRHMMDSLRHLAVTHFYHKNLGGRIEGVYLSKDELTDDNDSDYNVLTHGMKLGKK